MATFVIEIIGGQHAGAKYPLQGDGVTIGRDHSNSICLEDWGVSRKHARVVPSNGAWLIEDLNSRNGVVVAGKLVTRQQLASGDEIVIGNASMRFVGEAFVGAGADEDNGGAGAAVPQKSVAAAPAKPATPAAAATAATARATAGSPSSAAPAPAGSPGSAAQPAAKPAPAASATGATIAIPKPAAPTPAMPLPDDEIKAVQTLHEACQRISSEMGKIIIGQREVIDQLLVALFCRGHCLMVGVPGLAKTLMVRTLAQALDLNSKRIQFTPDLMPSDITGTQILEEDPQTRHRAFRFVRGPVFTNILLADEINRTPPKTQAALLEAMQEGRVTAGGATYLLDQPFFVLATQNPIEQEGTYPLPEAQLDRFMFMVKISYPARDEEMEIYRATTSDMEATIQPVLSTQDILRMQKVVRRVPVSEHVVAYMADLVRATRPEASDAPDFVKEWLSWGAGPRAGQYLLLSAKARAVLQGRMNVSCEDVKAAAHPVLRHRIFCNFNATSQGVDADKVVAELLNKVPQPSEKDYK
jgi:MoxR-like ATPase